MRASWFDEVRFSLERHRLRRFSQHTLLTGEVGWLDVDGSLIRATLLGEKGPTIVMAPDPPNVIEHHHTLNAMLSENHRLVCLEMPGFGFSAPSAGFDFGIEANVVVLSRVLKRLALGPYVLALSCVAGQVALELAHREPDLVSHVVLIQTPCWDEAVKWADRIDLLGMLGQPYLGQLAVWMGQNQLVKRWYEMALPIDRDSKSFKTQALSALNEGAGYPLASALQGLRRGPGFDGVLEQPGLVVWGTSDWTHRKTSRASALSAFRQAEQVDFDGAGHFPELERPALFCKLLRDFLDA